MSDTITGGCLCGSVRYTISEDPKFAIRCYCRDCQKTTGTGHLPQVAVPRSGFSVEGSVSKHHRTSDAGHSQELGFCGNCGSPIYKMTTMGPDILFVTAGSLDKPEEAPAFKPVFEESRLAWDPA